MTVKILNKNLFLICLFLYLSCGNLLLASEIQSNFKIFDGTLYSLKPQLAEHGVQPLKILYASTLWPNKTSRVHVPDISVVDKLVNDLKVNNTDILCLDIEHWNVNGDDKLLNIGKYEKTIQLFRRGLKDVQIGYYGLVPERNYWASMKGNEDKKNIIWKNTNLELADFAKSNLDVIYPSLYTFYTNQNDWKKYAVEHIKEAKKYGKPVYAFLWPLYHESNSWRGHEYIGDKYWRLQLETVLEHADGVVLWGGWDFKKNKPMVWDDNTKWWVETKNFIQSIKQNKKKNDSK